jgi:hypothetical protein
MGHGLAWIEDGTMGYPKCVVMGKDINQRCGESIELCCSGKKHQGHFQPWV